MSPYLARSQTQRKGEVVGEEEIYLPRARQCFRKEQKKKMKQSLCTGYSIFDSGSDIKEYCTL